MFIFIPFFLHFCSPVQHLLQSFFVENAEHEKEVAYHILRVSFSHKNGFFFRRKFFHVPRESVSVDFIVAFSFLRLCNIIYDRKDEKKMLAKQPSGGYSSVLSKSYLLPPIQPFPTRK